jgi:hypothetical protein
MDRSIFAVPGILSACALAATLVLTAAYAPSVQAFDCALPRHHCIKVTVDAATNTLAVDADPLSKKGTGHQVHWVLDNEPGQSYTFPATGIAFSGSGARVFTNCGVDPANAHVFHCADPTGTKGTYKYTVTVSGNPRPPALDPRVINN